MALRFKLRTSRDVIWLNYSLLDSVWGVVAPLLAFLLREAASFDEPALRYTLLYAAVAGIFSFLTFTWFRLSQSIARYFSVIDALNVIKASLIAVLLTALTWFMLTRLENIPRSVPVLHFILLAGGNISGRALRQLRRQHEPLGDQRRDTENVVIIGVSELAVLYIQMVEKFSPGGHGLMALLDNRESMQGRFVRGYPVAGRIREVGQVLREYELHGARVERIILTSALQALSLEDQAAITQASEETGIPIKVLPVMLGLDDPSVATQEIMELDAAASRRLLNRGFWVSKRLFDIVLASFSLVALAPVFIVTAALVIVDAGTPFLFWQVRIGRHRRRITIYKFRTLRAPYSKRGENVPEEERLSAIGRLLRKVRLDELPQLVSILLGDMSFIGPRPLLPELSGDKVGLRLTVRPGITGWAQVNGATLVTNDEKIALDEWYVRRASWSLELKIVVQSFRLLKSGIHRNEAAIQAALSEKAAIDGDRIMN